MSGTIVVLWFFCFLTCPSPQISQFLRPILPAFIRPLFTMRPRRRQKGNSHRRASSFDPRQRMFKFTDICIISSLKKNNKKKNTARLFSSISVIREMTFPILRVPKIKERHDLGLKVLNEYIYDRKLFDLGGNKKMRCCPRIALNLDSLLKIFHFATLRC